MCMSMGLPAVRYLGTASVLCLAVVSSASVVALFAIDSVSWARTSSLRDGARLSPWTAHLTHRRVHRTSALTLLPALAGATLGLAGVASLAFRPRAARSPVAALCIAAGVLVTEVAVRKRVTSIELGSGEMAVLYARSPPRRLPWSGWRAVRPPRWPLGGWRLVSNGHGVTLMPTDLWGLERILERAILTAGLRFDGRDWVVREPAATQETVIVPFICVGWTRQWKK
jgi:hypothetical protein